MPNSIGVIDQLSLSSAKPNLFIKRKEAIFLIATGQVVWVEQEKLVRKTPKYRRLTPDRIIHRESDGKLNIWEPKQSGYAGPLVLQLT